MSNSLTQFFDDLFYPNDVWSSMDRRRVSNAISNIKNGIIEMPQVDLYPVEGGLELKADLPGYNKQDIRVDVNGPLIIISGERRSQMERDESKWHYAERQFGKFRRTFRLPFNAESQRLSAKYEHGVLTVHIPQPDVLPTGQVQIS